ncbi:alginate biosynthesis protein AlgP [Burkholderia ubonensis]|uniref:Alginate biosynthesis protein AlgP n=1 Tax=Burkholderia ubonensis TaxID=101571 RepID=A0A103QV58_9BURK|nr:PhaM family polyhydroxyalkanoate granule multifunctional regulatory protein [Burkholderia ubonensis]AOJ63939.1 alginate biosynthesis protein AlgP [Burkholderia ubonensis]KVG56172.1 alginate biosynthesis protein AlgP [Burkholderia ubonensis]
MTIDTTGSNPFSGFAGFQPADMLERMWEMIRMTPFGGMGAFPGATHGLPPSLSGMSDMMAPLASVEELDKRITDLRAVEQWLKLNLGMLQSAIQAMEVQRATLATLRAFGAFAQTSMSAAEDAAVAAAKAAATPLGDTQQAAPEGAQADAPPEGESAAQNAAFDPAGWWNLLQTQFNQLASLAMTQPGAQAAAPDAPAAAAPGASAAKRPDPADPADPPSAAPRKPAAKRAKPAGSSGSAAARAAAASTPASRPPKRST